ncbi:hypothetical protein B1790_18530 [Mycobacterium sp. AT1]|nr:hypothetical protein B1790_18530 [Mycobacterium sp. AT1]
MSGQVPDPTGTKILDAARGVLEDFGFKHATIELVAKSAGVSHMTIYRRWPTKVELLTTALLREFSRVLSAAFDRVDQCGSFDEELVRAFTEMLDTARSNAVIVGAFAADGGDTSQRGNNNLGSVMIASAAPVVADHIGRLANAELDPGDEIILADVFLRLMHSLLVLDYPGQPLSDPDDVRQYALRTVGPLARSVGEVSSAPEAVDSDYQAGDEVVAIGARNRGFFRSDRSRGADARRSKAMLSAAALLSVLVVSSTLAVAVLHPDKARIGPVDISRTEGSQQVPVPSVPGPFREDLPGSAEIPVGPTEPALERPAQFGESVASETPTPAEPVDGDVSDRRSGASSGGDGPNDRPRPPRPDRQPGLFTPQPDEGPQSGPMPRPRAGVPGSQPGPARPPQQRPRPQGSGGTAPN